MLQKHREEAVDEGANQAYRVSLHAQVRVSVKGTFVSKINLRHNNNAAKREKDPEHFLHVDLDNVERAY